MTQNEVKVQDSCVNLDDTLLIDVDGKTMVFSDEYKAILERRSQLLDEEIYQKNLHQLKLNKLLLDDFIRKLNYDIAMAETVEDITHLKNKYVKLEEPVFTEEDAE